ncbi:hypothetical protein AVEN_201702-1 [Araneus ventricosus]|uniref:Glucose-methanol-choline oxidoreductase C-terminal domain-containing protein n=1 Tax=Araneus ventricosus TaxID=182803 RepID=A0A4Y2MUG6_ARAVE|nr:hypothetical protein AVEN_238882-1 [Araneus ventricosus]GBN29088.1 hypothetical protein AVEN_215846-1 [Araneus ventricosus]GBN29901.1 hypothetical protein AVEN_16985-1 [Araneus ventricosus]GBN29994.1 hypothetical protein AVEN_201702-1 [Araneus ventricosus]
MAFLNSRSISPLVDIPDYQIYFAEISDELPDQQRGLKPEVYSEVFDKFENGPKFICLSQNLQPKSRGTVRLKSTDPYDSPAIDPNYFEDPDDIRPIVEGKQ